MWSIAKFDTIEAEESMWQSHFKEDTWQPPRCSASSSYRRSQEFSMGSVHVGKANAISITYHDWGWFIAPIEMVFYFGWFMNYWVYGLPHYFWSKSMLPRDTSYHQLRYQYIKILNKIRKQNQIGAGASEAQLPGDANSGMAVDRHGAFPDQFKFSFGHHGGSHVDADHFFWPMESTVKTC